MTQPPPTDVQIAAFLKRRMEALRRANRDTLLSIVHWYRDVAGLGVMRAGGRIVAVALARCVRSTEEAREEPYAHHEDAAEGKIIWVEQIASLHPDGIAVLLGQAMHRFGRREVFAGNVFSRAGELRMLPWSVVQRIHGIYSHG